MTDATVTALPSPSEAEVDEVLAEFGGDHRAAIAALLHDLSVMAEDYEASISRGYVRLDPAAPPRRRARG